MTAKAKNVEKIIRKENQYKFDDGITNDEIQNATADLNKSYYSLRMGKQWLESIQMCLQSSRNDRERAVEMEMMLFSDNQMDVLFETLATAINDVNEATYLLNNLELVEDTSKSAKEEQTA